MDNRKFEICMSSGLRHRVIMCVVTKVAVELVGSVYPDCTVSELWTSKYIVGK
jgi:hypothetical protein